MDVAIVLNHAEAAELAKLVWEGDSHEILSGFPDGPRGTLGYYLYLLQKGETPPNSSSTPGYLACLNYGIKTKERGTGFFILRELEIGFTFCIVSRSGPTSFQSRMWRRLVSG